MGTKVNRQTVDLSAYPDLVVIYLGMRVNRLGGLKRLFRLGPQIAKSHEPRPEGLLVHENLFWSLFPLHVGMRQYWRDFESLEKWTRSEPHRTWWQGFLRDSGGTAFWHETYLLRGGMEGFYGDLPRPMGMMKFAPVKPARGPNFSARKRAPHAGEVSPGPVSEDDLYAGNGSR